MMRGSAYDPLKRLIDVLVSAVLLVATAPVQALVAVAVRRNLGSPVLFRQDRPGRNEVIFELVKFRTMRDIDETMGLVTDEQRLTAFGSLLRSTSLDELPSLWNVLRGDMSLVGPRPLLVRYLDRYAPRQRRRHEVRPGITGLAQVNGRNAISWEDKLALDVLYVENRSLTTDLAILARTVGTVLRRGGIDDGVGATAQEFNPRARSASPEPDDIPTGAEGGQAHE